MLMEPHKYNIIFIYEDNDVIMELLNYMKKRIREKRILSSAHIYSNINKAKKVEVWGVF